MSYTTDRSFTEYTEYTSSFPLAPKPKQALLALVCSGCGCFHHQGIISEFEADAVSVSWQFGMGSASYVGCVSRLSSPMVCNGRDCGILDDPAAGTGICRMGHPLPHPFESQSACRKRIHSGTPSDRKKNRIMLYAGRQVALVELETGDHRICLAGNTGRHHRLYSDGILV